MSNPRNSSILFVLLAVTACASGPDNRTASRTSSYQCLAGETLICEVRNTSRITHGSFSKNGSNCACQDASRAGATIIPDIQQ